MIVYPDKANPTAPGLPSNLAYPTITTNFTLFFEFNTDF
jgi:hypothetical protein